MTGVLNIFVGVDTFDKSAIMKSICCVTDHSDEFIGIFDQQCTPNMRTFNKALVVNGDPNEISNSLMGWIENVILRHNKSNFRPVIDSAKSTYAAQLLINMMRSSPELAKRFDDKYMNHWIDITTMCCCVGYPPLINRNILLENTIDLSKVDMQCKNAVGQAVANRLLYNQMVIGNFPNMN